MLLRSSLTILCLFCFTVAWSQQQSAADTLTGKAYCEKLGKTYAAQNELFLTRLKERTADKALFKHYESRYKDFFKTVNDEIKEGQMAYIPVLSGTLDKILTEIKTKNTLVPKDIQAILVRANQPNAHVIGDNMVFVNMGVFYCMEDEAQVAGILAHEVSHLLMDHSIKGLNYSYEKNKESIANVKAIKEVEVHKTDRAFELVKDQIYQGGKLRKTHELQADSLGYVLFRNTGYDKKAFIRALAVAEYYDTLSTGNITVETYKQFFDLPEQKFKDAWLKSEDFSQYNYNSFTEKFNKDSVSSHPKIRERIEHLARIFPELAGQESIVSDQSTAFREQRVTAEKERLKNLYINERYGEAVYLSLLYLQKDPADSFSRKWLGKNLRKIYQARKDYQLNKYLDRISPKDQTESYMRFLSFMWNLKLEELKLIAEHYTGKKLSPADQ